MLLDYLVSTSVVSKDDVEDVDLSRLLQDFQPTLEKGSEQPLHDNEEYMRLMELYFLLKNLRELTDINLYQSYYRQSTTPHADVVSFKAKYSKLDRARYIEQLTQLDRALLDLRSAATTRLAAAEKSSLPLPRIVQLCKEYGLSQRESDLFQLMVVTQGSNNAMILNSLSEEDFLRKMTSFQRLCNVSEVDVDIFCDGERSHMKENIVAVDEENGTQFNLRVQKVAVQLLYGRKVKSDDLLKISQTTLEDILLTEQQMMDALQGENAPVTPKEVKTRRKRNADEMDQERESDGEEQEDEEADGEAEAEAEAEADEDWDTAPIALSRQTSFGGESVASTGGSVSAVKKTPSKPAAKIARGLTGRVVKAAASPRPRSVKIDALLAEDESIPIVLNGSKTPTQASLNTHDLVAEGGSDSALSAYDAQNQLEYLEDSFQLIALLIKGNVARLKDDLKKEGTSRYNNSWGDGTADVKHSKRELQAKLKLQESRIQTRLQKTKEAGLPLPRLESLTQRLQLDSFEKRLVLLLIGKTVAPIVKTLLDTLDTSTSRVVDDAITVGQALSILCQDFNLQIAHRRYFYQSSKLLKNAVISLSKPRWHSGSGDLTENRLSLDRRILDWTVGLDSEINELVEGSDLYEPRVSLSQVVLPAGHAEKILSQCGAYDAFQQFRVKVGLTDSLSYGNSLVMLLWGKSGTGKTMTVNAVAHALGKKVLLVDFNSLLNRKDGGGDLEVDLKGLFRESAMNNAVLFFDECETIFRSRNLGADRVLNSLLTEIERHEGIVFMATNRPYDIDEAMHRRITMVLEYREPDVSMRRQIWDNLLGIAQGHCRFVSEEEMNKETEKETVTEGMDTEKEKAQEEKSATEREVEVVTMTEAEKVEEKEEKGLLLSTDVDTAMLSAKFALTGGFIKNAVLSAMLSALSRNRERPVLSQRDLVEACKLQMRGNLTQRASQDRPPLRRSLRDLAISESDRNVLRKILRYEEARDTVFGSWSFSSSAAGADASGSSSSSSAARIQQKACINLLAGNRGSGKATVVETVAYELGGKRLKWLHVADFATQSLLDVTDAFKEIVKDASIIDAVIVLDGFEHLLEDPSAGPQSDSKVHLLLSRIMDILFDFRGCVFLIAHIENPQNITLQRDFGSLLYSFLRFVMPSADVRSQIWKTLIPPGAPVAANLDFTTLGRKFELFPGSIQSAITHAAAEAASRQGADKKIITQKDLLAAGEYEIAKLKSGNHDLISKLFT